MAFTALTSAQCDANSPLDETLVQLIRTDLDDLNSRLSALESVSSNDIRDNFSTVVLDSAAWSTAFVGAGTAVPDSTYEHSLTLDSGGGIGDVAVIGANTTRFRCDIAEERTVIFEVRARLAGWSATNFFIVGLQDNAVGLGTTTLSDITDCIVIYSPNSGQWTYRQALGGAATESVDFASTASWQVIRFEVTCSATAGNRKVTVFLNGTAIGAPFTTNLPTARLRPVAAAYKSGGGAACQTYLDYCLVYDQTRPLAP